MNPKQNLGMSPLEGNSEKKNKKDLSICISEKMPIKNITKQNNFNKYWSLGKKINKVNRNIIPPENGGIDLMPVKLLWSEVFFLSLKIEILLIKKFKIKLIAKITTKDIYPFMDF